MAGIKNRGLSPTLREIQLYCQICDYIRSDPNISFHEIARSVGRSTSAISECITKLQRIYKVVLIDRTARRSSHVVTPDGRVLYEQAVKLLAAHSALGVAEEQQVAVGTTNNLLVHVLPGAMASYRAGKYRGVKLRFNEYEYTQIVEDLRAGRIHFGLDWEMPGKEFPGIELETFAQSIDMLFICHVNHPLAAQMRSGSGVALPLDDLSRETLVTVHPALQPGMERLPLPDRSAGGERIELSLYSSVLAYVRMGLGVGIYPGWYWELERLRELYFCKVEGLEPRHIAAYLPPGGRPALPAAARALLKSIETHMRKLQLAASS